MMPSLRTRPSNIRKNNRSIFNSLQSVRSFSEYIETQRKVFNSWGIFDFGYLDKVSLVLIGKAGL